MKNYLVLITSLAVAPAVAQVPAPPPEEMQRLGFLIGEWEGEGWMAVRPGQRHSARVTEVAQPKAGGAVLLIEGLGRATAGGEERVIHDAVGLLRYDREAQGYRFTACRAGAGCRDTEAAFEDGALVWGFEDPRAGRVRYTMRLNERGQWYEVGEVSRDGGETWSVFMQVTLDRKGR